MLNAMSSNVIGRYKICIGVTTLMGYTRNSRFTIICLDIHSFACSFHYRILVTCRKIAVRFVLLVRQRVLTGKRGE